MITEIPTPHELEKSSRDLIRLAWQIVVDAVHWYNQSDVIHERYTPEYEITFDDGRVEKIGGPDNTYTNEEREAAARQYWDLQQPALSNALVLLQQSIELGLKARIAAVSPFLLIARDPRDFPHESKEDDIPFSTFRTIDAADLLRVHNAISPNRLGKDVSAFWAKLRQQRNIVMHLGWNKAPPISAHELVLHVLFVCRFLYPDEAWPNILLEVSNEPYLSFPYDDDDQGQSMAYGALLEAIETTLDQFPPNIAANLFGFNPKYHTYHCPKCLEQAQYSDIIFPKFAQLEPRSPKSMTLYCFICKETTAVVRQECEAKECPSNVLSTTDESWGKCLVCGHENTLEETIDDP